MSINAENLDVINNEEKSRYETHVQGMVAFAEYSVAGKNIVFTHTEVPVELEGHGIASRIAKVALDDAVERGLKIQPLCPFIKKYIYEHPEYQPYSWGFGNK